MREKLQIVVDKEKTLLFITTKLNDGFAKQNSSKTRLWWKTKAMVVLSWE
jgi:hypothetical protein